MTFIATFTCINEIDGLLIDEYLLQYGMIVRMHDISVIVISFVSIELVHTVSADKPIDDRKMSVISFYDQEKKGTAFNPLLYIDAIQAHRFWLALT